MSTDVLKSLLRTMLRIRVFEEKVAATLEHAPSEIKCPCHLYIGQEAIAAGACAALNDDDYVWGGHRSHGHYLAKGGDMRAMMAELFGRVTGCARGRGGSMHLLAKEVGILGTVPLVAATIPLAVGTGLASQLRKDGRVSVSFFGDGATEEGHFHESMNLAALHHLPVVFVCENNLYSSHMHILERRPTDRLVPFAEAHGIPGARIDGNDVRAVHLAAGEAVERARSGAGPTFLECLTYRWRGHVGPSWDMDVGVKRSGELRDWLKKDPLMRARRELTDAAVGEEELDEIEREARSEVEAAFRSASAGAQPDPSDLHEHVYVRRESDR